MAKRKKAEPITGVSRDPDNKLTVLKSTPLFALWRSELSLAEFKILDTYLARIDAHHPEKRAVRFEKGELEKLLGVKKINVVELKERLKHLGTMVEVDDPTRTRAFRLVALFEQAECEQDENGLWQVDLECTQKAMKYVFNVENLGYLRYKLRAIVNISSRYSYILFLYLEQNRYRKTWEIGVDELRQLLRATEDTYQEFKRFNDLILKKCYREITEKTECKFSYFPVKKGRTVRAIRFELETSPVELTPPEYPEEQLSMDLPESTRRDQYMDFLAGAVCPRGSDVPEFGRDEMEQIDSVLVCVPDWKLPQNSMGIEFMRYHYLDQQYKKLNALAAKKPIKHRLSYLCKMIQADTSEEG